MRTPSDRPGAAAPGHPVDSVSTARNRGCPTTSDAEGDPMTDTVQFARAMGPASALEAHRLRHEAQGWLAGLDMDDEARERVLTAVSEAVENAVEHAYP